MPPNEGVEASLKTGSFRGGNGHKPLRAAAAEDAWL